MRLVMSVLDFKLYLLCTDCIDNKAESWRALAAWCRSVEAWKGDPWKVLVKEAPEIAATVRMMHHGRYLPVLDAVRELRRSSVVVYQEVKPVRPVEPLPDFDERDMELVGILKKCQAIANRVDDPIAVPIKNARRNRLRDGWRNWRHGP